ncbi:SGNH/GDSL hydrolase family protein [Sinomonas albida]|uniref:SGNH/GDSL hydrolase family protein n=1 Tax=Sinomonas albida TaxID=369942 RepID=UPI0030194A74
MPNPVEGRMDLSSPLGPRIARAVALFSCARHAAPAAVLLAVLAASGCAAPTAGTAAGDHAPSSAPARQDPTPGIVPLALSTSLPKGFSSASPDQLPLGSVYFNPSDGRREVVLGSLARTAVLIGDSQSEPTDSWVRRGLEQAGYTVYFAGRGGTGFTVSNPPVHDYVDALRLGDWLLPHGKPSLVVVQGGGNDASRGSTDAAIVNGEASLLKELARSYPSAKTLVIGTLAKSAADGGGRRPEVDALLGRTSAQLGVPFIACGDWISRYGLADLLADGVHLKPAGKARLAPVLAAAIAAKGLSLS